MSNKDNSATTSLIQQCKIVVIGESGAGKSSIILRYCAGGYKVYIEPTIGAGFSKRPIVSKEKKLNLCLWDTAGQERYRSLLPMYLRSTDVVLLVYPVDKRGYFEEIEKYWMKIISNKAPKDCLVVLVSAKIDLDAHKVSTFEGQGLAAKLGIPFFEVSAKLNQNVDALFEFVTERIASKFTEDGNMNQEDKMCLYEFQRTSKPLMIYGARSFWNSNKINGRYIPDMSAFRYENVDTTDVYLYRKGNKWQIEHKSGKILAYIEIESNQKSFEPPMVERTQEASKTEKDCSWHECCGLLLFPYYRKMPSLAHRICEDNDEDDNAAQALFAWENGRSINLDKFVELSKEPERLGLNILLFIRFIRLRLMWLSLEFVHWKEQLDYDRMTSIQSQYSQLVDIYQQLSNIAIVDQPDDANVPQTSTYTFQINDDLPTRAYLQAFLSSLIGDCKKYFDQLCDLKTGNFAAARCCRSTIHLLEEKLKIVIKVENDEELPRQLGLSASNLNLQKDTKELVSKENDATSEKPFNIHKLDREKETIQQEKKSSSSDHVEDKNPICADETLVSVHDVVVAVKLQESSLQQADFAKQVELDETINCEDSSHSNDMDEINYQQEDNEVEEIQGSCDKVSLEKYVKDELHRPETTILNAQNDAASRIASIKGSKVVITRIGWHEEYSGENFTENELEWKCTVTSGLDKEINVSIGGMLTGGMASICAQLSLDMQWSTSAKQSAQYELATHIPPMTRFIVSQEVLEGYVEINKTVHLIGTKKKAYPFRIKKEKTRYQSEPLTK